MSSGKLKSSFDMEEGGGEGKGAAISNGANGTNGHSAAALGRVEMSLHGGLYGITPAELGRVLEEKDMQALSNLGNAEGLAKLLATDLHRGLDPAAAGAASITSHRDTFGANVLPETPPKSFFRLAWENLHDPIIILLMFAALVSTVLGAAIPEERAKNGWIEGVAIWIAVLVVVSVGAGNDWQKDRQFRKLNAEKDKIQIKVIRGGQQILVEHTSIVVGDLLLLDTGDKVIADGVLVSSQGLVLDEASLTGESDPVKKNHEDDPWIRSGTQVSEGSGHVLVCAVGVNSMWGKTMALMQDAGDDQTPLQQKLEVVAMAIGKVGFAVAICCFIALLIKWCVQNGGFPISKINNNGPVQFFLYAITIVVVAVPEGLPLAVTISLAYSMKKMMKDNNFVRVLAACETMGGATAICSDKTGTLTENRMTVVEGWFENKQWTQPPTPTQLASGNLQAIEANIALNSKAFLIEDKATGKVDFVGNRTECALLMLLKSWGLNYQDIRDENESRITKLYGFTSAKKMAGVLVKLADKYRLYNKGAAEWVLKECTQYVGEGGKVLPLSDAKRDELLEVVTGMAKRGLRCICMSYTDLPLEDYSRPADHFEEMGNVTKDLIVQCIVGIKDPVRMEVPAAVATCKRAGIVVRMVTGDNIHTARHIARECGILFDDGIAMEGPDFRVLEKEEMQEMLPNLQVLARSSPEDKLVLVRSLKELGEVVAVTGDGTNDAPALKESDVGLAMGIAGTEVAKEAADIVILDDNFSSIVKSVLWGRSVFNNIRKFLQFQLTVNFVALVTAFVGAVVGGHEPLNVLQLLWVNMIMDTMGALALATEPPSMSLLDQKPNGRTEPLINNKMWKHILVQGFYQLGWLFCCLYGLPVWFPYYSIDTKSEWLADKCYQDINGHYGQYMQGAGGSEALNANVTAQYGTDIISFNCNLIAECGWMVGEKNDPQCLLSVSPPWANHSGGVPSPWNEAICGVPNVNCLLYEVMDKGYDYVDKQWEDALDDEYKPALSILFNAFIMCQLANEINSRRINDEYNVFEGFFQSPIFITVIVLTLGFQAIIMELLGTFFKVNGLTWWEWLICFGAGLGAFPVSFITRFITRNTSCLP